MVAGKGQTQIQVEVGTVDALKKLRGMCDFETIDELIWAMIKGSKLDILLTEIEDFEEEVETMGGDPNGIYSKGTDEPILAASGDEADEKEDLEIDWEYDEKIDKYFGFKDDKIIFWDKKNNIKERMPIELLKYINGVKKKKL